MVKGAPKKTEGEVVEAKRSKMGAKEEKGPVRKKLRYGLQKEYRRHAASLQSLKDEPNKKVRSRLKLQQKLYTEAVRRLADAEVLQTESTGYLEGEGLEKTFQYSQEEILQHVDVGTAAKKLDLELSYGPYDIDFTRNGRYILLGGRKGALSVVDCNTMGVVTDLNVQETVRCVKFLHNYSMFAAAQKKYVHIYDSQGTELHCLKEFKDVLGMTFLPYHFLLVTTDLHAHLKYIDTSTGTIAANFRTKRGPTSVISQNPQSAVVLLGHSKGNVTLWTPNVDEPCVDFLCHHGGVTAMGVMSNGNNLVTAGADGKWKVWDIRNTYQEVSSTRYFGSPPKSVDVSQTGLVALGIGEQVWVYRDVSSDCGDTRRLPYMTYRGETDKGVHSVAFRPFEDFCCVGTSAGLSTLVIPGAASAQMDTFEVNPFETRKQRREGEIRQLLDKLPPDSIVLDPSRIGEFDRAPKAVLAAEDRERADNLLRLRKEKHKQKNKMRGKGSTANVVKSKRKQYAEEIRRKVARRLRGEDDDEDDSDDDVSTDEGKKAKEKEEEEDSRFLEKRRREEKRRQEQETRKVGGKALDRFRGHKGTYTLLSS